MSDQPRKKQPRKILGGLGVNSTNSGNCNLNTTTTLPPSVTPLSLSAAPNYNVIQQQQQQQQQMDRLRLMSQEMHALWPYGAATFLSPVLPAPNVALPYALAGTLVPIYQPTALPQQQQQQQQQPQQQQCANISVGTNNSIASSNSSSTSSIGSSCSNKGGQSNSNNSNNNNDTNKINIQIGLQCVSQNAPMNFNTMNEMNTSLAKINLLNFCSDKENKETSSSLRSSPMLLSPDDLNVSPVASGAGGDATNSPGSGNGVTLSQAKFNELTRLALRGSEIAEKLAYTHRNRPCFKKIDSLCARMKQDLIRPDGVLPNINSQGIAWAVKDFIFVFTRVINAWIIIKGYVYNTPEGLNKVKAALSPDFAASFAAWQDTTMDFVENLIKSFVNLDNLVQSQKNVYQKSDNNINGGRTSANTTPIKLMQLQPVNTLLDDAFDFLNNSAEKSQQNSLNKNYLYTMVEDSEGSQRQATVNGTYFKTGTYNPIKKDSLLVEPERASIVTPTTAPIAVNPVNTPVVATPSVITANNPLEQYFDEQMSQFWPPTELIEPATTDTDYMKIKEKIPPNWPNYDIRVLEQNLTEFSNDYDPTAPPRPLGKDLIDKLNIMIERLMAMKHADLFFKLQFTKNYFPDFIAKHKHEFMDVRSIILKCQVGGYQHIFEVVHDVKRIIHIGKEFLKYNVDSTLQKSIVAFDLEFNKLLCEPPFENYQFDHITGEPKEMLYNCRSK